MNLEQKERTVKRGKSKFEKTINNILRRPAMKSQEKNKTKQDG